MSENVLFSLAFFVSVVFFVTVSGNKCTNVLSKSEIHEVVAKEPCVQKYTARCGWLSLNYCTFYHNTYCDKKVNETVKTYYIKTDCCKGFIMAPNGTCIKMRPGVVYNIRTTPVSPTSRSPASLIKKTKNYNTLSTYTLDITDQNELTYPNLSSNLSSDPHYKEVPEVGKQKVKDVKMEISGGGYAGIACGLILIITIVAFIIIAVRKRKRKKQQHEARQAEQVLYIGPTTGNQSVVRNLGNSRTPSIQISREATPSSSKMVTPPTSPLKTSPLKTTLPVEVPLINQDVNDDDIPESNV